MHQLAYKLFLQYPEFFSQAQVKDFAQAKLDSAKQKVKDLLQAVKEVAKEKIKNKLREQLFGKDTTTAPNNNPPDTVQKKPTQPIKNVLKSILNRNKKPAVDSTKKVTDTTGNR